MPAQPTPETSSTPPEPPEATPSESNIQDQASNTPNHDHSKFLYILITLMAVVIAGLIGYILLGSRFLAPSTTANFEALSLEEQASLEEISDNDSKDPNAEWASYANSHYSLRYPPGWLITSASSIDWYDPSLTHPEGYIKITNPDETVGIIVTAGENSFGFGSPPKTSPIDIVFNDKLIELKELSYSDTIIASFQTDVGERKYSVLFGTGALATHSKFSSDDYYQEKENILQILSTFEILDAQESTSSSPTSDSTVNNGTISFTIPQNMRVSKSAEEIGNPPIQLATKYPSTLTIDVGYEGGMSCIIETTTKYLSIDGYSVSHTTHSFGRIAEYEFCQDPIENQRTTIIHFDDITLGEKSIDSTIKADYEVEDEAQAKAAIESILSSLRYIAE